MGIVYLGRSDAGKLVAIKTVRAEYANDQDFRKRFGREVAAARSVSALHTAVVVDSDGDAETPWFATTFIDGPSLDDHVRANGPLDTRAVLILAVGLAEALTQIHFAGLIHRDLKPGNILLTDHGPCIIDFGIALVPDTTRLTGSLWLGTAGYAAPERFEADIEDPAGDIFSLGATLVFAATGHGMVGNGSAMTQVVRMARGRYELADVPKALRPIITRCVARNPKDRPTAGELIRILVGTGTEPAAPGWYLGTPAPRVDEARRAMAPTSRRALLRTSALAVISAGVAAATNTSIAPRPKPRLDLPAPTQGPGPGQQPASGLKPGKPLWTSDELVTDVAVANSLLYAVDTRSLRAYGARGGGVAWRIEHHGIHGQPVPWDDLLAVKVSLPSGTTGAAVVDAATGLSRFHITEYQVDSLHPTEELLLVGVDGGVIYAYERSGAIAWMLAGTQPDSKVERMAAAGTSVIIHWRTPGGHDEVEVFDAGTGSRVGTMGWVGGPRLLQAMGTDDAPSGLVLTTEDGTVRLVSHGGLGTEVWQSRVPTITGAVLPAVSGGLVVVADHDGVAGHDRFSGERMWHQPVRQVAAIAVPPMRDKVYVAANGDTGQDSARIVCLDPGNGAQLWAADLPGWEQQGGRLLAADDVVVYRAAAMHVLQA